MGRSIGHKRLFSFLQFFSIARYQNHVESQLRQNLTETKPDAISGASHHRPTAFALWAIFTQKVRHRSDLLDDGRRKKPQELDKGDCDNGSNYNLPAPLPSWCL